MRQQRMVTHYCCLGGPKGTHPILRGILSLLGLAVLNDTTTFLILWRSKW